MKRTMLEKQLEDSAVRNAGQLPQHWLVYAAALILGLSLVSSLAEARVTRMVITSRETDALADAFCTAPAIQPRLADFEAQIPELAAAAKGD